MPKLTFAFRNRSALKVVLGRTDQRLKQGVKLAVLESGERLQRDAKANCPVDTGFMRDHIRLRFTRAAFGYDVGWDERDFRLAKLPFYVRWVVYGTRFMAGRDFLTPAWQRENPRFTAAVRQAIVRAASARTS